ncbi:NrdC thioredoxin [Escherichia phage JS10]|uniref:NrdC thioredoxin n=5 Tax=Dhakavirus TaxID=1914165 RepID=C4MZH5_9CAUD|nr:NrdC thioredoxin [Escherichia phage JS98]YP_002922429.1 NrdC thioredoxin [Escherichia phage JS10]YP_003734228.1 NrdC thioredoxin [Escherichia phage IME08]YP_007004090.1 NrdC thioredoxin [Escherichia phage Bp7]ASJ79397.1 nucleotidyltransferase [Salmonella phage SHP1]QAY00111.1 thioredoxin [Escherichia phage EcWhh-1]QIN95891.1 glutaredoxin [Escherichia phage MN04]QPI13412.1 thioredoxin [Salmonella phage vB_SalM_ABTNLsp5]QVW28228.1 thioredoxin [Escherichia phage C6]WQZ01130.1 thioredoxin [
MFKVYGYDSNIHRCVFCDNAKRLLDVKKQPYEFINVMPEKGVFDDEKIAELLAALGRESQVGLTMPQVFAPDGTSIGGFDQLRAYFK